MPADNYTIKIEQESKFPDAEFYVLIEGTDGSTSHRVHIKEDYWQTLTGGGASAKELLQSSLRFLLEREPNTAILDEFSLATIERYFPDYKTAMQGEFIEIEPPKPPKKETSQTEDAESLQEKFRGALPTITFKGEEGNESSENITSKNES